MTCAAARARTDPSHEAAAFRSLTCRKAVAWHVSDNITSSQSTTHGSYSQFKSLLDRATFALSMRVEAMSKVTEQRYIILRLLIVLRVLPVRAR